MKLIRTLLAGEGEGVCSGVGEGGADCSGETREEKEILPVSAKELESAIPVPRRLRQKRRKKPK